MKKTFQLAGAILIMVVASCQSASAQKTIESSQTYPTVTVVIYK